MPQAHSTETARAASYVALSFDGLSLLFDQREVAVIEQGDHLADLQPGYAMYRAQGSDTRVYTLSHALHTVPRESRAYFVIAHHAGGRYGLACEAAQVYAAGKLDLKALPTSLRQRHSPLEAYAQTDGKLLFLCNSAALAALLPQSDG